MSVNLDRRAILEIIKRELAPLINDPLQGKSPPANRPSTIERKGGRNTPLRDTGRLLDDIVSIDDGDDGVKIYVMNYYHFQRSRYRLLFRHRDVLDAVRRAREKIAKILVRVR